MSRGQDWVRAVAALPVGERWREILTLPPEHRAAVLRDFAVWAEPGQLPPHDDWAVWLMRAGRGFGKTRAGAEWVVQVARGDPEARIALVGGTMADVERVMIGGESGLLACARSADGAVWKRSEQAVHFASGAVAYGYSAEAPEGLRGPQHHAAWCDELGKWRNGDVAWDNLVMGMRLGERPRLVVTTTPRPTVLMRRVMALPQLVETHGTTRDNPYLPDSYRAMMEASYAGTRLGRQELDGEMVEEVEGGRPAYFDIETWRVITDSRPAGEATSEATVKLRAGGDRIVTVGEGNGPVNALDHALRQAIGRAYPEVAKFELIDYKVRILDQGHGTDAITRVLIETTDGESSWVTVGVGANVIEASWGALVDGLTFGLRRHHR